MRDYLEIFERKLEQIMEIPLSNLIDSGIRPADYAEAILAAVEEGFTYNTGQPAVAQDIVIRLSEEHYRCIKPHEKEMAAALSEMINELSQHAVSSPPTVPAIRFIPDRSIDHGSFTITTEPNPKLDTTHSMAASPAAVSLPQGAHIILNEEHIPLVQPVVNIGRRSDNHIQLNDRNVSRIHAQIRARGQNFLIIDLGSTTGTFLNDNQIRQAILHSGDVISIGNQKMIYLENQAIEQDSTTALKRVSIPGQEE
jgi:hypothetical protein